MAVNRIPLPEVADHRVAAEAIQVAQAAVLPVMKAPAAADVAAIAEAVAVAIAAAEAKSDLA